MKLLIKAQIAGIAIILFAVVWFIGCILLSPALIVLNPPASGELLNRVTGSLTDWVYK